jgi:mRNA turnover protein 4
MESQFRQIGVSLKLENGKFIVLADYTVCKSGEPLTPEQALMVKHLGIQMDEFKFYIGAYLTKGGEFKSLCDVDI